MNFTERSFVILFAALFPLWWMCRRHYYARAGVLLAASMIFYGYHQWELIFLLLSYCVVDWFIGLWITKSTRPEWPLTLGVTFNLVVLAYWKYTPMLVRSAIWFATSLDLPAPSPVTTNWAIPFGISFFAFTGIAYLVDVYRGDAKAEPSLWRFTLYISFFPQLVAGPILRAREFLGDLQKDRLPNEPAAYGEALWLLARGFFKKMVLADRIALAIDPFFTHVADGTTAGVWSLPFVYLYALQIYFDFSGYTDIARGLGLLFGFRWPHNFNLPYLATSVQDFWRRWHITLSRFLRDYLYIPLGGSKHGEWRTMLALMATMLLGGIWHGASWSFMLWGGLHGMFLVVHRVWQRSGLRNLLPTHRTLSQFGTVFSIVVTFHCVCLAWCFFRLTHLPESLICVEKWFVFDWDKVFIGGSGDPSVWLPILGYGLLSFAMTAIRTETPSEGETLAPNYRLWPRVANPYFQGCAWGCAASLLVLAVLLAPGGERPPFIYFQF